MTKLEDARTWLCNGGGGHENGEDGLRALTVSRETLIEFLNEYRDFSLRAFVKEVRERMETKYPNGRRRTAGAAFNEKVKELGLEEK